MDQEKTGKFIAALRKEQTMTQKELAKLLGVSDKTVSKWETGRGLPDISIMQSLCQTLGVSINELLSGDRLDENSYREKAEENLTKLMNRRNYKEVAIHIVISGVLFLLAYLVFPLSAEKIIPPVSIPIGLFWSILLMVANFVAGITYGLTKRWKKRTLFLTALYNVFLLLILLTVFAIAAVVFSTLS